MKKALLENVPWLVLCTKLKSNMQGISGKLLFRKRAFIETVNDELKNIAQVEHSRHRRFGDVVINLPGGWPHHADLAKKPRVNLQRT